MPSATPRVQRLTLHWSIVPEVGFKKINEFKKKKDRTSSFWVPAKMIETHMKLKACRGTVGTQ